MLCQLESSHVTEDKRVILFTDGACIGNPGPGGWACILRFKDNIGELFGSVPASTNNRMELQAVIEGIRALRQRCRVLVYTDSQYVKRGVTEWLQSWKANGWRKSKSTGGGRVILNQDLWMELDTLLPKHEITWHWVKGHANNADNVRCDFLATKAAREQTSSNGVIRSGR